MRTSTFVSATRNLLRPRTREKPNQSRAATPRGPHGRSEQQARGSECRHLDTGAAPGSGRPNATPGVERREAAPANDGTVVSTRPRPQPHRATHHHDRDRQCGAARRAAQHHAESTDAAERDRRTDGRVRRAGACVRRAGSRDESGRRAISAMRSTPPAVATAKSGPTSPVGGEPLLRAEKERSRQCQPYAARREFADPTRLDVAAHSGNQTRLRDHEPDGGHPEDS